jgi:DNA replication and repair protein RecF
MHLENIYLANFKNYKEARIDFSKDINALVGDNGSGKTNLLDAIHFLSLTKSAFNGSDQQCILHGQPFYSVVGSFIKNGKKTLVSNSITNGKRKKVLVDESQFTKIAEFIGQFPTVLIAPNDHSLITGAGESRRRFFDSIISQLDQAYLLKLLDYNRALKERNALLSQFAQAGKIDQELLEPYNQFLLGHGIDICYRRLAFSEQCQKKVASHYRFLTNGKEEMKLVYQSVFLEKDYEATFRKALEKDITLQRTSVGVHRDDYLFEMEELPLKRFGSQGQQKSFLIALKLAQFELMRKSKGFKPILLLDDIFDKLDEHRIKKLTEMLEQHQFGQVFITDARPERTFRFLKTLAIDWKVIRVISGTLQPDTNTIQYEKAH